ARTRVPAVRARGHAHGDARRRGPPPPVGAAPRLLPEADRAARGVDHVHPHALRMAQDQALHLAVPRVLQVRPTDYPNFNKMWIGNFVSRIGSEMTFSVAIPYQVYELTNKDPNALGKIGLARGVPIILTTLLGGVIADAF